MNPPGHEMYYDSGVNQLEYGKVYIFQRYKNEIENINKIDPLLYLKKWDGFSGNEHQNNGNCGFLQSRFILKSDLSEKQVFKIIKHKLGIKI